MPAGYPPIGVPPPVYSAPFSVQLLEQTDDDDAGALVLLLPASYRTDVGNPSDDVAAPRRDVMACVAKELDLQRLDHIFGWLWIAGLPLPPRPLHQQCLLGREIIVAERMDMHLVWTTGRITVKPVPRFLLEPRFWTTHLACQPECPCMMDDAGARGSVSACRQPLRARALGFLFSYAALIAHESDFHIAADKHLLPSETRWHTWRTLVEQLDTAHIYDKIDRRFYYGELRLSRLNKIYRLGQGKLLDGYMPHWNQYGHFLQDNFTWLASATVIVAVILTAMQVGLATDALAGNDNFQSASYGFTIFSILGPLVATALVLLLLCYLCVHNWIGAMMYKKKRFRHINHARKHWKDRGRSPV